MQYILTIRNKADVVPVVALGKIISEREKSFTVIMAGNYLDIVTRGCDPTYTGKSRTVTKRYTTYYIFTEWEAAAVLCRRLQGRIDTMVAGLSKMYQAYSEARRLYIAKEKTEFFVPELESFENETEKVTKARGRL